MRVGVSFARASRARFPDRTPGTAFGATSLLCIRRADREETRDRRLARNSSPPIPSAEPRNAAACTPAQKPRPAMRRPSARCVAAALPLGRVGAQPPGRRSQPADPFAPSRRSWLPLSWVAWAKRGVEHQPLKPRTAPAPALPCVVLDLSRLRTHTLLWHRHTRVLYPLRISGRGASGAPPSRPAAGPHALSLPRAGTSANTTLRQPL